MPDEIRAIPTATGRRVKIKPEKRFDRLDKPFNDAVRDKKKSAVTNVLLRKELPGELASRTAKKVLRGSPGANSTEGAGERKVNPPRESGDSVLGNRAKVRSKN